MRGSGWIPFVLGLLIFVAAAGYPLAAAIILAALPNGVTTEDLSEAAVRDLPNLWPIARTTALWAAAAVPGALLLGWWPGRLLGRLRSRIAFIAGGSLCMVPLCLPDYVLYWSWWQAWPVDSQIHRWAVTNDQVDMVRSATLWLGLVWWSWPIAAWIIAARSAKTREEDLLALDTRSRLQRGLLCVRQVRRELALASVLIFAFIFNNTTTFDLAQVPTLGYELRALMSEGFASKDVLRASWPGVGVVFAAGMVAAVILLRRPHGSEVVASPGRSLSPFTAIAGGAILVAGVAVPAVLSWHQEIDERTLDDLINGYGRAAGNTACAAGLAGIAAGVAAIGIAEAFSDRRKSVRAIVTVAAVGWLIAGIIPAVTIAAALEGAYNITFPSFMGGESTNIPLRFDEGLYRTAAIMIMGYLARFGFVAVLLGWWLARAEEREMLAMRELDGGTTLVGLWRAWRPRWLAAGGAAFAIVTVLSMGEVSVTALIQPPGFDAISAILLNNMHYQRSEMVALMARILIVLAAGAALAATIVISLFGRRWRRQRDAVVNAIVLALAVALAGCDESMTEADAPSSPAILSFGGPGRSLGQFVYPRAMDVDPAAGFIYIIDRSGRVQRFGLDGQPQKHWLLPRFDNGYPTGVTVAPDGRIFVADTHAHCISIFDQKGTLLEQFGEYGTGPGQFVFPSDVAFGPEGRIYVSEFGDNDRIQVFDRDWNPVLEFGGFGSEPGRFNRPQSLVFKRDLTELFVADACNHRVQVFDPSGNLIRIIGSVGTESGKFRYPYGVVVLAGDRIAVTEFGNHRVQILDLQGQPLGVIGRPGEGEGELMAPWTSAVIGDDVYVLDSRNSRVQVMSLSYTQ